MITAAHGAAVMIDKDQLMVRPDAQRGDEFVRFHLFFVPSGFLGLVLQQTLFLL